MVFATMGLESFFLGVRPRLTREEAEAKERERRRCKYVRERANEVSVKNEWERLTSELAQRRVVRSGLLLSSFAAASLGLGSWLPPFTLSEGPPPSLPSCLLSLDIRPGVNAEDSEVASVFRH